MQIPPPFTFTSPFILSAKLRFGCWGRLILASLFLLAGVSSPLLLAQSPGTNILPRANLASQYFGNDSAWYASNIPFFDCSDTTITQVYYYRWALYKSHLKDLGNQGYISTEFLNDVSWARFPYQSLNDATAYHIHEGRWLKEPRYVNDYISYMYLDGGNDRHFSESLADATYSNFLARGDLAFATQMLAPMRTIFSAWGDRYDSSKGLYWIEPIADATEYTISSIDASNGRDGFGGGNAFRPSINSFMYANAQAISKLSALNGDSTTASTYAATASALKDRLQAGLWNPDFEHFTDRFQVTNSSATVANVSYWNFIRGRELVGYTPWYFGLPNDTSTYAASWSHALSSSQLAGPYGLRTNEPSYQFYMRQYRYEGSSPECQWNGPSWPFQTTLTLGGMANLLNDYTQRGLITADTYSGLLHQYAQQHFTNGTLDLQEDYQPDTGKVIVGLARSHHYNHSSFPDLVITGLAGLRPQADNTLVVNPLIPSGNSPVNPITYFCLENAPYHGHAVTIVYDKDGTHYNVGVGLSVYIDGIQVVAPSALGKKTIAMAAPIITPTDPSMDLAINFTQRTYPAPSASSNSTPSALFQALDGRVWYWSNVANYWTNSGSTNASDWYAVDFGANKTFTSVGLNFFGDGVTFAAPSTLDLQYWTGTTWASVASQQRTPATPLAGGENTIHFPALSTSRLRIVFNNPSPRSVALVEFKAYGDAAGLKYVDLRATDTTAGTASWTNQGALGAFTRVGSPTVVADVGGTGIPGVLFNGTADAYQGPNTSADLDGSSDRTIEVWAYNPSLAAEETMVSWGYRGATRRNLGFNFGSNSTYGSVTHYTDDVAWGGTPPTANSWHHLVYTYSSRGTRIYVDGKIVTSKTVGAELDTYASQPINLGCQRDTAGGTRNQLYSGYLNTVRVYGGALTPAQIVASYASGPAMASSSVSYFTQLFNTKANNTANQSFTFTPDGSSNYYTARKTSAKAFPTDPTGGTAITTLGDDNFALVTLTGGAQISLYGTAYNSFYVGSNGYITFGSGDTQFGQTTTAQFSKPRISALLRNLDLRNQGSVTSRQLSDRVAVTYQNVPQYGASTTSNNFQIEMFFDGRIRITLLALSATDGVIGLSAGAGVPADFVANNFSAFSTYSSAPNLSSLTPGAGTLSPAFAKTITSYASSLSNPTATLTLTPTTEDSGSTVKVNGINVSSGQASQAIALNVGINTIPVLVSSWDGTSTNTYLLYATRQSAVESWRQTWYGTTNNLGAASDGADPYHTGIPNLAVFAFFGPNQDPGKAVASQLPQPQAINGNYILSFTQPAGVSGVTYGAEWSATLAAGSWQALTDSGTGGNHLFSVPIGSYPQLFTRWRITGQ